jgi:hypothetical protein
MNLGHLHIGFKDLAASIQWMEQVLGKKPAYQNQNMAVFPFEHMSLLFDRSDEDAVVTVAFDSKNCDADFATLIGKNAKVLENPADQPWGVRVAYLQGPGKTTIEIEQPLK